MSPHIQRNIAPVHYVEERAEGLHMRHRRCSMIYSTQHSPVNTLLQACVQFSHVLPRQNAAVSAVCDAASGPFIRRCMERRLLLPRVDGLVALWVALRVDGLVDGLVALWVALWVDGLLALLTVGVLCH